MPGFGKGGLLPTARGLELGPAKTLSHRLRALQLGVDGHNEVASVDPAAVPCGSPKAAAYPSGSVRRAQDSWLVWTPGGHRAGARPPLPLLPQVQEAGLGVRGAWAEARLGAQPVPAVPAAPGGAGAPGDSHVFGGVPRGKCRIQRQVGRRVHLRRNTAGRASRHAANGKNKVARITACGARMFPAGS